MKKTLFPLALAGLLCTGAVMRCASDADPIGTGETFELEPNWVKDMRVTCSYSGGMVNESRRIDISSDSAVYELRQDGMGGRYRLNFTHAELDQLAKVFYENDFVDIRSSKREGTLYDAPSSSVMVCRGFKCSTKGDDAYSVYTGSNAERIQKVSSYVWETGDKKLEALKVPLTVIIDEKLLASDDEVHYQVAPGNISFATGYNGRHDKEEYKVLPGRISIVATTSSKDPNGRVTYPLMEQQNFSTDEGNTIIISKKDGTLNIEFKKLRAQKTILPPTFLSSTRSLPPITRRNGLTSTAGGTSSRSKNPLSSL